jgi:hypothetical protein
MFEVDGQAIFYAIDMVGYINHVCDDTDRTAVVMLSTPVTDIKPLKVRTQPVRGMPMDGDIPEFLLVAYPFDTTATRMYMLKQQYAYTPENGRQKYVSVGLVSLHDEMKNHLHHDAVVLGSCNGAPLFNPKRNKVLGVHCDGDYGVDNGASDGFGTLGKAKGLLYTEMKVIIEERNRDGDGSGDEIEDA